LRRRYLLMLAEVPGILLSMALQKKYSKDRSLMVG
jgi:hypothetical protein